MLAAGTAGRLSGRGRERLVDGLDANGVHDLHQGGPAPRAHQTGISALDRRLRLRQRQALSISLSFDVVKSV